MTTALQEAEKLLPALSRAEKVQLMQAVISNLRGTKVPERQSKGHKGARNQSGTKE